MGKGIQEQKQLWKSRYLIWVEENDMFGSVFEKEFYYLYRTKNLHYSELKDMDGEDWKRATETMEYANTTLGEDEQFKHDDIIEAYREYYRWKHSTDNRWKKTPSTKSSMGIKKDN